MIIDPVRNPDARTVLDVDHEVHAARLDQFQQENEPFIQAVDTHSWFEQRNYDGLTGEAAFDRFAAIRIKTLARLEQLAQAEWEQPARHAILGPTDLRETMRIMAVHDQVHIRQIHEILAANQALRI